MVKFDVEKVLNTLVVAKLPRFSGPNKFFRIDLNLNYAHYSEDDADIELYVQVNIMYQRQSNYTKVLYNFSVNGDVEFKHWKLACDHDSCWRYTQFIRDIDRLAEVYFEEKGVDYKEISEHFNFTLGNNPKIIFGKLTPLSHDHDNRDYDFEQIKDLTIFQEFENETRLSPWNEYTAEFEKWVAKHKAEEGI